MTTTERSALEAKTERFRFRVEPFHVDLTGHIFLGVLGNHLLNAADHHSSKRGFGIAFLMANRYTWVLSRLSIEMAQWPTQYEEVEVETWVESVMKLFTERNFLIRNARDGRIYGYARSIWAMISTETRHPANLLTLNGGSIVNYIVGEQDYPCPIARYGKRPAFGPYAAAGAAQDREAGAEGREPAASTPPSSPAKAEGLTPQDGGAAAPAPASVTPHYSDVDINGHVNSIKYIEHILDLFPRGQFEACSIRRFEIAYKTESYLGDTLTLSCQEAETPPPAGCAAEHHVEIRKQAGSAERPAGETVVQAKIFWAQRS